MNLLTQRIITDNQRINAELDEYYGIFGPEPEPEVTYKIENVRHVVVQDKSPDYLFLIIQDGKTVGRIEKPF